MSNVFIVWCILMVSLIVFMGIAYWFGRARQIQLFNQSQREIISKMEEDIAETEQHIARVRSSLEAES